MPKLWKGIVLMESLFIRRLDGVARAEHGLANTLFIANQHTG
ncbi:hypothetical protein [Ureibacillus sinduriensis]|nr:hypothetical protein [Ureibacillus sinduriensis]